MSTIKTRAFTHICAAVAALVVLLPGCIKNDIPYPRIAQRILAIAAEGESKSAYIDSLAFEVNIYLEETTDIRNVRFTEYSISPDAVSDPDLRDGVYDLSSPLFVTLSLYQDYTWEIIAHQDIERYFKVSGEIGESVVDAAACRVVVNLPEGTDLSKLTLESVKLGPVGITTISPELRPGPLDLSHPLKVEVTAHGRTETWTIYAQLSETLANTTAVDAWSRVIWAYGTGQSELENGFEYRRADSAEWTRVPAEYVSGSQGIFSCYIPHLEPLTEYCVRAYSGDNFANEVRVTTDATADIPDGTFDQWSQTSAGMWNPWSSEGTRFWDTGNRGSWTAKINLTSPSDHTSDGTGKAAKCETLFIGLGPIGRLSSGSIFTGEYLRTEIPNGVLGFGRPWKLRPTKLKGYYQYSAAEINTVSSEFSDIKGQPDTCHIYVALTDWTAPFEIRTKPSDRSLFDKNAGYIIAYGELQFSGKMDAYRPFEIKLDYRSTSRVPTYMQITCSASKYGDYFTGGSGSVLYVDEFSFDYDY